MRTYTALTALLLLAVTVVTTPIMAAPHKASLRLKVADQTGAVLPEAKVTIYTLDGKPAVTATADDKGIVEFPSLTAGVIAQIHATYPGFAPYIEATRLQTGANVHTATLRLAPVDEIVYVTPTPEIAS